MSKIEWTDKTWNPTVGCTEISAGCRNCYAARMAWRLAFNPEIGTAYQGLVKKLANGRIVWTGNIKLLPDRLLDPARTKKPTRYFVDSMSDLFHPDIPFEFIAQVYAVMALCPQHTFQVLTKRPERAAEFYEWLKEGSTPKVRRFLDVAEEIVRSAPELFHQKCQVMVKKKLQEITDEFITDKLLPRLESAGWDWNYYSIEDEGGVYHQKRELTYHGDWPLPNVWIGISVENQKAADARIPVLLKLPAAVRFLSCEPLLGPVDAKLNFCITGNLLEPKIDWIIVGGESGLGARPMHPDWARSLRDQCQTASVAFFFKQWGEFLPFEETAQQPFYREAANGEEFDAHGLNFIDPETGEPGHFKGHPWMDGWEALMYCEETENDACQFLRRGKHNIPRMLDGQAWNQFPATKMIADGKKH